MKWYNAFRKATVIAAICVVILTLVNPFPALVAAASSIDLTVTSVNAPTTGQAGGYIAVSWTVKNQGSVASGTFYNRISLATTPYGGDISLGNYAMASISAGSSLSDAEVPQIPSSVSPGYYYVTVYADSFVQITEYNEGNNIQKATYQIYVSPAVVVPTAPTLNDVVGTSNNVLLAWTDNSNNEDGFKIERKEGTSGTYAQVATTGANVYAYANTGLQFGKVYCYRVRAYNSAGDSGYSNEKCATTLSTPALSYPSNGATLTTNTVTLTWNCVAGANAYAIKVSRVSCGGSDVLDGASYSCQQQLSNLANGVYYWQVQAAAFTYPGLSEYSACRYFTVAYTLPSTISCSPPSFSFTATQGGSNPSSQTLSIWNSGGGTLSWSVSDNANWLTLAPASGSSTGETDSVTLSVSISGMSAGSYSGTITISASGATNTPQTVPVSLTINPPSPSPAIGHSPPSFSFTATQGGSNPSSQTLSIWNSGGGTLSWSVSDNANWLTLAPASGSSTGETDSVTLSVSIAGMSAGSYSATITISAPGATNTPQTIPVSLTIIPPPTNPTIGRSPSSFSFSATQGGANPSSQTLSIWNSGSGTLSWSVSDSASWLTLSPTSGTATTETDSVTLSVSIAGMSAGSYSATITISASGATNSPQTVSVSLTVNAPSSCWSSDRLSSAELADLVVRYFPDGAVPQTGENIRVTAYAVARAESDGNPSACGDGGQSIGLWQIYMPAHPEYSEECLFDPDCNAQAALAISNDGNDWNAWCTWEKSACGGYGNEAYEAYLDEARAALGTSSTFTELIVSPTNTVVSVGALVAFEGTVLDQYGNGMPGYVVGVDNPISGICTTATTGASGQFTYSVHPARAGAFLLAFYAGSMTKTSIVNVGMNPTFSNFANLKIANIGTSPVNAVLYVDDIQQGIVTVNAGSTVPFVEVSDFDSRITTALESCPLSLGVAEGCIASDGTISVTGGELIQLSGYAKLDGSEYGGCIGVGGSLPYLIRGSGALCIGSDGISLAGSAGPVIAHGTIKIRIISFDTPSLTIGSWCPVSVVVTGPGGEQVGYAAGTGFVNEFKGATYNGPHNEPGLINIPGLTAGDYKIEIIGTDNGDCTISYMTLFGEDEICSQNYTGTVTKGQVLSSTVALTTNSGGGWEMTSTPPTTGSPFGGCFIATAAYSTPMADEVQVLREFRDQYLLTNALGRAFVNFYYATSPSVAQFITVHPGLKPIVRAGLVPAVAMSAIAVNTGPKEKVALLAFLVLICVAMALWITRRRGKHPGLA